MTTQEDPMQPDFRVRAKTKDVAVARLVGFEASEIADGHATVTLSALRPPDRRPAVELENRPARAEVLDVKGPDGFIPM